MAKGSTDNYVKLAFAVAIGAVLLWALNYFFIGASLPIPNEG